MSKSFADMKRSANKDFEQLNKKLSELNNPGNRSDDRIWTCHQDKAGNGFATIRFLPAPAGEDFPFVRMWNHAFKGPGGWYIENSLTTLGQDDPVNEMNQSLWQQGEGSLGRKIVSGQGKDNPGSKRALSYYSNIYVINDPAKPENNGKVFLFRYGKKIFDMLNDMMNPADDPLDPKEPFNPFDFWAGANFKLKIRRADGYPNYDKSEFETPGPLFIDDKKMEEVWKQEYSLQEIVAPDKFKSYDQLKARLDKVFPPKQSGPKADMPWEDSKSPPVTEARKPKQEPFNQSSDLTDDDDEELKWFQDLADSSD